LQSFADQHSITGLPADAVHVAAFVVARYRAGVSASGLAADLSAIGWCHGQLDPPVEDVTGLAKQVLRHLRGDGSDKPLSPAPVLPVGALVAMVSAPVRGVRRRSAKLIRQVTERPPRQLLALRREDVGFAEDLLVRDLADDEPVFIDRQLAELEAITRDGVKRAATAAGLACTYASHSLRARFVTHATPVLPRTGPASRPLDQHPQHRPLLPRDRSLRPGKLLSTPCRLRPVVIDKR